MTETIRSSFDVSLNLEEKMFAVPLLQSKVRIDVHIRRESLFDLYIQLSIGN